MLLLYELKDVVKNVAKIVLTMNETEQILGGFWYLKSLFVGSFLAFKLVSFFIIIIYSLPIELLASFPVIPDYSNLYWPLYSLVGIGMPLSILYIKKRLLYGNKTK